MLRELSKLDPEAKLPARRWMAVHGLRLLGSRRCAHGGGKGGGDASWFKIGMVAKCGWMFVAQLFIPAIVAGGSVNTDSIRLSLRIVHQTPRVQLYNSSNERLAMLGGMALQFSLPEIPVPSSAGGQGMVWLGDVKALRYTMPSKDKYVLCEGYGKLASSPQSDTNGDHEWTTLRQPGEGLILAKLDEYIESLNRKVVRKEDDQSDQPEHERSACRIANIAARVSLPNAHGSPLSLAVHPGKEWVVVSYGTNSGGGIPKPLELISLRKALW